MRKALRRVAWAIEDSSCKGAVPPFKLQPPPSIKMCEACQSRRAKSERWNRGKRQQWGFTLASLRRDLPDCIFRIMPSFLPSISRTTINDAEQRCLQSAAPTDKMVFSAPSIAHPTCMIRYGQCQQAERHHCIFSTATDTARTHDSLEDV